MGEVTAVAARLKKLLKCYLPPFFFCFIQNFAPALGPVLIPFPSPHPSPHLRERAVQGFNILIHLLLRIWRPFLLPSGGENKTQRHHFSQHGPKQLGNPASPLSWSQVCHPQMPTDVGGPQTTSGQQFAGRTQHIVVLTSVSLLQRKVAKQNQNGAKSKGNKVQVSKDPVSAESYPTHM